MAFGRRDTTPLEKRLGHRFKRLDLMQLSLTHRSWANEQGIPEHYERLEFLGDAVLGVVTAEWLYANHPELPEGELSKHKAQLVSFGALYLDGGLEVARRAILPMLESAFEERARQAVTDAKTQLQEVAQALGW